MKKLNNKGFAITTLLYGLLSVAFLIMTMLMGIMSTNRQNTSVLVDKIEEELNRYGETETTFAFLGESQEYIVPYGKAGWYKIELWGAQTNKGTGSYTSGIIFLEENQSLYFYLGETCSTAEQCNTVFNKGNTEVRITPSGAGNWDDAESKWSTIMRAGGTDESYVSGMAGMKSVDAAGNTVNIPKNHTGEFFLNGLSYPGGNDGHGMANIELVSSNVSTNPPSKKVDYLNSVRYIKVCTTGNTQNDGNHIVELQAINMSGDNVAKDLNIGNTSNGTKATDGSLESTGSSGYATFSSGTCAVLDLGWAQELSEVGVWHYFNDRRTYKNSTISVSGDGVIYRELKKLSITGQYSLKSTSLGERYTAWQPDTTTILPNGNYYITSVKTIGENHGVFALTAQNSRGNALADTTLEKFKANKFQKWTIEQVDIYTTSVENKSAHSGKTIYKIYESENKTALQIQEGTGNDWENACNKTTYRGYEWDLWEIIPQQDGTYRIKSLLGTYLAHEGVVGNNARVGMDYYNSNDDTSTYNQKWQFVNAEY